MGRTLEEGLLARFSDVPNFTGYMRRVHELLADEAPGLRILDVPAGNGLLADALEASGHSVVRADIVSTPNIPNFYSRVTFLLQGVFFQFSPAILKRVEPGEGADRGHVAPIGIYEIAYLMATFGARLERTLGDHFKKKVLLPVFLLLLPVITLVTYPMLRRLPGFLMADGRRPGELFMNRYALLSRSLICVFRKD